jgi:hypothetical protein
MKVSRDTETHPLSQAEIQQIVQTISSLHPNYITVDTHWDYPDYMQEWINAIRAVHPHVWFREHPNQWENDNGATGIMTPQAYEDAEQKFIVAHPSFFQSGDIFDACSEPEEGPYWQSQYGNSWTSGAPNTATQDYNKFLRDTTDVADAAFQQIGVSGVITTLRSTNSFFALTPSALEPATVQKFGYITVDSYPEQDSQTTDPAQATKLRIDELNAIYNVRHVPIVLGEMGYSNNLNLDDATQETVLKAEFAGIAQLSYVAGLNYWVGPGSTTAGGYTYIIKQDANGTWVTRAAANDLSTYFQSKSSGDSAPPPESTATSATPGLTQTSDISPTASPDPTATSTTYGSTQTSDISPTALPDPTATSTTSVSTQTADISPTASSTVIPTSEDVSTTYEAEASANVLTGIARVNGCVTCSDGMEVVNIGLISTDTGPVDCTLAFTVTMKQAGSYKLTIYYINGDPNRTADLSVNGSPSGTIQFPQTGPNGDWSVVKSVTVTVTLSQGSNTLTFANPKAPGPNIDRIVV